MAKSPFAIGGIGVKELDLMMMNPEGFNWTSLNIAEWTGKLHKNVLQDIENEIEQLEELGKLIFQLSDYQMPTQVRKYKMYKLNKRGVMQLAARYSAKVRFKVLAKVEELTDKLNNLQLHKTHAEAYKDCMKTIYELTPEEQREHSLPAMKSATVVNKIVSTLFGFEKLIKKPDMNNEMIKARIEVQRKYEEIFKATLGDNSLTTDVLYGIYVPMLAESRKIKKAKLLMKG